MTITSKPSKKPQIRARVGRRKMVSVNSKEMIRARPMHAEGALPLLVEPAQAEVDLVSWAQNKRTWIDEKLAIHGGIAFRGFGLSSIDGFGQLAKILNDELMGSTEHTQISESQPIVRPGFYPKSDRLTWHNEKAYGEVWPLKIMFGAEMPAADRGGVSLIFDGRRMCREMNPTIRERFERRGVMYIRNYSDEIGRPWQQIHQTNRKADVEIFCRENGMTFEWLDGDGLRTRKVLPAFSNHPKTGETCWFNQVQHWHSTSLDTSTRQSLLALVGEVGMPRNSFYGDGEPIEDEVIAELNALSERIEAGFFMERGDVLLMDNMMVSHGRTAYAGDRKLLVALGEPCSYTALEQAEA